MSCDSNPQDRTVPILELVTPDGNDEILDARTIATMNTTFLPPPPPRTKDIPVPPLSHVVPLSQETKEILTNLANFLKQQNDMLKRVKKNQNMFPIKVDTRNENIHRNKRCETLVAANDTASIPRNRHKGNKGFSDDLS